MSIHLPVGDSTKVFHGDLFKGKVLFCTGGESVRDDLADRKLMPGRSGICYKITETMMRHGVSAAIVGRE